MKRPCHRVPFFILIAAACLTGMAADSPASDQGIRTIRAMVVADQHFARQTNWERKAREVIEAADSNLAAVLGIRLEITGYRRWRHSDAMDLYRLAEMMVDSLPRQGADILLGFTLSPRPSGKNAARTDGVTIPLTGTMIRLYQGTSDQNIFAPYVLLHELGHLLGGVHVNSPTLMSPVYARVISTNLDPLNQQIIRIIREIDFARGYASLSPAQLESLAGLYEQAINAGNHETVTLMQLTEMYIAAGDYVRAIDVGRRMTVYDPRNGAVWDKIGDLHARYGRADSAVVLLEPALEKVDDPGPVHRRLASLYFRLDDMDASRRHAAMAGHLGFPVDSALRHNLDTDTLPADPKRPRQ
ncbi:MAG: matrixin family metalloprotease [candidate division Zixibacteria bacterium]|nr:matrixin family metalloprotease [candidate division Zixibacteria bacterium]